MSRVKSRVKVTARVWTAANCHSNNGCRTGKCVLRWQNISRLSM